MNLPENPLPDPQNRVAVMRYKEVEAARERLRLKLEAEVIIKRDGIELARVNGWFKAIAWLHAHQPQSYDWALKHEGYTVELKDGTRVLEPYS